MTKSVDFGNEKCKIKAECWLGNSAERDGGCGLLWKLGTADVEGVESVCAIGAVLQEVFLRFRQFLSSLVFAETVPASADSCGLQCQDKIFIVLPIDKRHKFPATCKCLVDFEVFLGAPANFRV